jgi:hypothetical protein
MWRKKNFPLNQAANNIACGLAKGQLAFLSESFHAYRDLACFVVCVIGQHKGGSALGEIEPAESPDKICGAETHDGALLGSMTRRSPPASRGKEGFVLRWFPGVAIFEPNIRAMTPFGSGQRPLNGEATSEISRWRNLP